jgi:hypothetical protein
MLDQVRYGGGVHPVTIIADDDPAKSGTIGLNNYARSVCVIGVRNQLSERRRGLTVDTVGDARNYLGVRFQDSFDGIPGCAGLDDLISKIRGLPFFGQDSPRSRDNSRARELKISTTPVHRKDPAPSRCLITRSA